MKPKTLKEMGNLDLASGGWQLVLGIEIWKLYMWNPGILSHPERDVVGDHSTLKKTQTFTYHPWLPKTETHSLATFQTLETELLTCRVASPDQGQEHMQASTA